MKTGGNVARLPLILGGMLLLFLFKACANVTVTRYVFG